MKTKITKRSYISLPKVLSNDIKALGLNKTLQSHAFKFTGLILRDSWKDHGIMTAFTSKSQSYIKTVFDSKYKNWLTPLLHNRILLCDGIYSETSHKSYHFAVNPIYYQTNIDEVTEAYEKVGYKDIIKNIPKDYRMLKQYVEGDMIQIKIEFEQLIELIKKIVSTLSINDFKVNDQITRSHLKINNEEGKEYYISKDAAIEIAKREGKILIEDKRKYYLVNEDDFILTKKNSISNKYFDAIEKMRARDFKFSINDTNSRLDHNFTNMPSKLVEQICKDNNLVQLDLCNSQFVILSHILTSFLKSPDFLEFKKLCVSGELYDAVREKLSLENKKEAKMTMFELLFSSEKNTSPEKKKLREIYPSVVQWIDNYKKENGYKQFSIMLQKEESEIFIKNIWKTLKRKKIFCITKHDSLIYRPEDREIVQQVVKDYFSKINFECKMR